MNKLLALEVAREMNLSPEKVLQVCKSFHDGLKELLKKPAEAKAGIYITNFLSMNLREYQILHSLGRENPHDVETKEIVLENLKKYKRNENKSKKGQAEK